MIAPKYSSLRLKSFNNNNVKKISRDISHTFKNTLVSDLISLFLFWNTVLNRSTLMYQVSFSTLVRHLQDILRLLKNIQI